MDKDEVGVALAQALGGPLAAMGGAIVDDQEHPCGGAKDSITWSTSLVKAAMPVFGSQQPQGMPRRTSQTQRYWRAPRGL